MTMTDRIHERRFDVAGTTLAGTFAPAGGSTGPSPAALLLSGSGPLDRDSNTRKLPIGVMGQLADHLADAGVASFRYDKRGVGESGGEYLRVGLRDEIDDAVVAFDHLRREPTVDPDRIVVVGHSVGAWIALEVAAARPEVAGVVLLAGPAQDGDTVLRWQARRIRDTLPRPVRGVLRVLRLDLVKSQRKRLDRIRSSSDDVMRMQLVKLNARWFREFMAHDPVPRLEAMRVPVLAITGAKDIQVDPLDIERMGELVSAPFSGHIPDDLTHLLRTHDGPPSLRTYKKQAKRPVADAVVDTIVDWIGEVV